MNIAEPTLALQRFRVEHPRDPNLLEVSTYLINYPFANRLYPGSLDVIDHCRRWGPVVILSGNDMLRSVALNS